VDLCEGPLAFALCPLKPVWAGLAPTLGLQIMVAFLPTFIILIFKFCFTLRAQQWAQARLQVWFFWFQMFFVILATAIGQDFTGFIVTIAEKPFSILMKLADTMPYATHFYMNYLVLQWTTHAMVLTRYVPLIKFKIFSALYEEEDARAMAEPEDQDYYGMGARSARWTIMMVIALVFGTISPPINLLAFLNFALCRIIYGYLGTSAETKKTDLGGVFWVCQLEHLFWGNILYWILMTGVLYQRSYNSGALAYLPDGSSYLTTRDSAIHAVPAFVCVAALLFSYRSLRKFRAVFAWQQLPMMKLIKEPAEGLKKRSNDVPYRQPELLDDDNK